MQKIFKVNNRSNRCRSCVFIVNFEYIIVNIWLASSGFFAEFEHVNAGWDLNLSTCFKVESRSPVMFKMKLAVATVSSCYLFFVTKSSILDVA